MFLKVTGPNNEEFTINTSHIVSMRGSRVRMSNGDEPQLSDASLAELEEGLFGPGEVASPAASEHTSTLLTVLNKLCGGKGDAKPTTDRKARLKSRLKDFTEDELKKAATQLGQDEFMQGANENGKRYGTIDYLLRTSANVNKWLEDQPDKPKKSMF